MRSISSNLEQAIKNPAGLRMVAKMEIDPSYTKFNTLTSNNPYDANDYSEPTDNPVGQCMLYSPTLDKVFTFIVSPSSGTISGMEQGSGTVNDLGITANVDTKPACYELGDGTAYLWYWDSSNGLTRVTVNLSTWAISGSTQITVDNLPTEWSITAGSPHALSENQVMLTYQTSIGGIGVGYYDGSWNHWGQRFLSPGGVTATDWTIYSTAVVFDGKIFAYITDIHEGYVRGVELNPYKDLWSDSYEAMPADLSRFCITNAVSSGGYIHVAGQFHRLSDISDAKVYSLVTRSLDGRTFSWDRFTLLSTTGFQFQIAVNRGTKKVYASDRNSVGITDGGHFFFSSTNNSITLKPPSDIISLEITSPSEVTSEIKSYDEAYHDHPAIVKNSRVKLYLGYQTASDYEYALYQTYILESRSFGFSGKTRSLVIDLVDQASWKTQQIAFPFYSEILSKISFHDNCNIQDKTYPVKTVSPYVQDFLHLDFWNNTKWDGDGVVTSGQEYQFRSGSAGSGASFPWSGVSMDSGATDQLKFRTVHLAGYQLLDEYPTIRSTGSFSIRLYGWETAAWGKDGDYDSARANSSWTVYAVTAPTTDLDNKTVTQGTLTSTYDKFPQEFPDNEAGSYPIEYSFSGLTEDHVLLYFGITVSNTTTGTSVMLPERMEIAGINFTYVGASSSQAWETDNPDPSTYDREYLKNPDTGIPSILFTMRPYSAFNYRVNADFVYSAGNDPLSVGRTCWGVVGHAENGRNYVVARFHKQKSRIELVLVRDDTETVLAFSTVGTTPTDIMLDHRDGLYRVWYRDGTTTWTGPVITHQYDEVTNGRIATSDSDIMHTGIYTAIAPPGFLTPSFNMSDSDGIGILATSDDSILDGFPDEGKVVIDGQVYSYSGSTIRTNDYLGPYQGRQSYEYKSYTEGGVSYSGHAVEIAAYFPDSNPDRVSGLLMAADRGHAWLIDKTDWTVEHSTAGVPNPLRNRSRHYASRAHGNIIGPAHRVHFVPGLLNIEPEDESEASLHLYGSWVSLYSTDEIWVTNIEANTVARDATVRDMTKMLTHAASVESEFPGDTHISSLSLSTTPAEIETSDPYLPGGFDVRFTTPDTLANGDWIALYAGNLYIGDPILEEQLDIGIKNNGGTLQVFSKPQDAVEPDEYINLDMPIQSYEIRILFHATFCSVYLDGIWVATFAYGEEDKDCEACDKEILTWPKEQVKLYLYSNTTGYTANSILVTELFDWREAIYIESEMNTASALGSVFQERPIEQTPTTTGGMAWSYFLKRDTIEILPYESKFMVERHQKTERTNPQAGSDAVVCFTDVEHAFNNSFADSEGFLTRVFKLGTLETGAKKTAQILLQKSWEKQYQHQIQMRPDIRLEVGDRLILGYIVPGTERYEQHTFILDNLSINLLEGDYMLSGQGHHSTTQYMRNSIGGYLEGS